MRTIATLFSILLASILIGCAGNQTRSNQDNTKTHLSTDTYTQNQQIIDHCSMMAQFGRQYQLGISMGLDNKKSFDTAEENIVNKYNLRKTVKLDTVLLGYSAFINMAPGYHADTMGYYTLAQCLTLHGLKKRLPLDRGPKEQKIKAALTNCQNSNKTDDDLGACVLNSLRPMAESF